METIQACTLCPRACGANRTEQTGFCGGGRRVRLARAALHTWEEPCISGTRGSGAVFFSGCPLRCCFCQNHSISIDNFGAEITTSRLADIFLELQEQGAHNINLVSATQYIPWVVRALDQVRHRLTIPVVYNTGGYEKPETIRTLTDYVDIYLPDCKYKDSSLSARYSAAPDYFAWASAAIIEMYRQTGPVKTGADGLLQKGVMIRHLVLPGCRKDSIAVLEWIAEQFPAGTVLLSLMSQYTPNRIAALYPELNRRIFTAEYRTVLQSAEDLGLSGYMQQRSSAKQEYTPDFHLQGVYQAAL